MIATLLCVPHCSIEKTGQPQAKLLRESNLGLPSIPYFDAILALPYTSPV